MKSSFRTSPLEPKDRGKLVRSGALRAGISLIEVVVALCIASLLVVLAIQGTRALSESSRSVSCIAKLKNLHVAFSTFREDHNGKLYQGTQTYIPILYQSGALKDPSETICPSTKANSTDVFKIGSFVGAPGEVVLRWINQPNGYAINCYAFYQNSYPKNFVPSVSRLSAFFGYESKTPLLMDGSIYGLNKAAWEGEKRLNLISFRHAGKANVLFLDGHVESVDKQQGLLLNPLPF